VDLVNYPRASRNPYLYAFPNNGQGLLGGIDGRGFAGAGDRADAGAGYTTTLDSLPPFAPTATSVGFTVLLQLKAIAPGDNR
jgi:hypothetical protein